VDPSLVKEGQAFIQRNFFGIFFAHFVSLIILLCYTPVRMILLRTGKSFPMSASRQRYLSTLLHIKLWYEDDILSPKSRASKDILKIGCLHQKASIMNKSRHPNQLEEKAKNDSEDIQILETLIVDFKHSDDKNNNEIPFKWTDDNPISQLDMIVTQFCFMGFIYLIPGKFGIHIDTEQPLDEHRGMKGFVHVWAVLGYLLGIDDDFNLCLDKNQKRIRDILTSILTPEFLNSTSSLETVKLWGALISGIGSFVCCLKLKPVLLYLVRNVLELHKGSLVNSSIFCSMTCYEMFCYILMYLCIYSWMKLRIIVEFLNRILRFGIFLAACRFNVRV